MRTPTVVLALAVLLVTPALLAAQSTSATVSGSVLDEQKAALPGATVAVRNLDSGQARTTTTDERGTFRLVGLPPGRYEITADLSGFGRLVRSDLVLTVAQELTLSLTLRVAALQEAVTVTGELPLVETTRSALGTTITTTEIEEIFSAWRLLQRFADRGRGAQNAHARFCSPIQRLARPGTRPRHRHTQVVSILPQRHFPAANHRQGSSGPLRHGWHAMACHHGNHHRCNGSGPHGSNSQRFSDRGIVRSANCQTQVRRKRLTVARGTWRSRRAASSRCPARRAPSAG